MLANVSVVPQYYLLYVEKKANVDESKPCRLCAKLRSNRVLIPMFENGLEDPLANLVNKYLPVKILKDDKLPKCICKKCVCTLTRWDRLYANSVEADLKLRSVYNGKCSTTDLSKLTCSEKKDDVSNRIILNEVASRETKPLSDQSFQLPEFLSATSVGNVNDPNGTVSYDLNDTPTVEPTTIIGLKSDYDQSLENNFNSVNSSVSEHVIGNISEVVGNFNGHNSSGSENFVGDITEAEDINNCTEEITHAEDVAEFINNCMEEIKRSEDVAASLDLKEAVQENNSVEIKQNEPVKKKPRKRKKVLSTCPVCNKTFAFKHNLRIHSAVHSLDRPFVCKLCGASFKRNCHLRNHNKGVHERVQSNGPKRSLSETNAALKAMVGEFTCDKCQEVFTNKYDVSVHMRKKHPTVPCNICDKMFSSIKSLYQHKAKHSTSVSSFVCDICGKIMHTKHQLQIHLTRHSDEHPYMCDVCGKRFQLKHSLKTHSLLHTTVKDLSCPYCDKKFRKSFHLKTHIRTHTGEKPYLCPICNRGFAQSGDRNKHIQTHNFTKK